MKKKLFNLLILSTFYCYSQYEGPIVSNKLDPPEISNKNYLQKRSQTWIKGQWKVENNHYTWVSGHWVPKRLGFHFINGYWLEIKNGWVWMEGYWEQMPIKKWKTLYS